MIRRIGPRDTAYLFLPLPPPLRLPPKTSPFFAPNSEGEKDTFFGVISRGPFRGSKGSFLRHGVSRPVIRRITPRDTAYLFLPLLPPLRPPPKTSPFFTPNSEGEKDTFLVVMSGGPFRGSKGSFLRHGVSRPVIRRIGPRDTAYLFLPLPPPPRPPPKISPFFTPNSEGEKDTFLGVMSRGPFRGSKGSFLRHGVSHPVIRRIGPRDTAYLFLPLLRGVGEVAYLNRKKWGGETK